MNCYSDILQGMLYERGVDPWEDFTKKKTKEKM